LKVFVIYFLTIFLFADVGSIPIDTPDSDERNNFVIKSPDGWGYRTFNGDNGLIGVMWPAGTTFNSTDTAVFIFLQDNSKPIPKIPCNINLFTEKCLKAKFKFATPKEEKDTTKSLGEKYFNGRCGRTMIIMKETIDNYNIIITAVSAGYITKSQLADIKKVAKNYKNEAEKYIRDMKEVEPQ
jgi:hypothetical protein